MALLAVGIPTATSINAMDDVSSFSHVTEYKTFFRIKVVSGLLGKLPTISQTNFLKNRLFE